MVKKVKKENKENNRIDAQGTLITAFVIVVVTIGFIGGFVLSGDLKERIYRANNNEKSTESSDILAASTSIKKTLGFDEKYVSSSDDLDYVIDFGTYAGSTDAYFTVQHGDNKKELLITKYSYESDESQEYVMPFSASVVDVYLGRFNNDPQYNTIFYLLDNGNAYYSNIEEMVQNDNYGSYYSVEGLSNIAKFYVGKSCDHYTGDCISTTFAQTTNGIIFDLNNYIN